MKSGVYKITHIKSNRSYFGSALDVYARMKNHRYTLNKDKHHNILIQKLWNKYGADAFTFSVVLICKSEDRIFYEQLCLDGYRSYEKARGLNIRRIAKNFRDFLSGAEAHRIAMEKMWQDPEIRKRRHAPESGERYGRLVLVELREKTAGSYTWLCKCDCGRECLKQVGCLRRGDTLSCGCLNAELASKRRKEKIGIPTAFVMFLGKKVSIRSAECKMNIGIGGITRKSRVNAITRQEACNYFVSQRIYRQVA